MTKKQVVLMSFVVAIPALALLTVLVLNGMSDGGKMFSGMMTVIVAVTGLLVLGIGLSPVVVMAFYPAEGFRSFAPPPQTAAPAGGNRKAAGDGDDDEFESEDSDGEESFDDGGFNDDGMEDGGFEEDGYAATDDSEFYEDEYDENALEEEEEWT